MRSAHPPSFGSLAALVVVALVFTLSGCGATTKEYPVDRTVLARNERDLWNSLRVAISDARFPVGAVGADPARRRITSGWKETSAPFRKHANRKRVLVEYEPFQGDINEAKEALGVDAIDPDLEVFDVSIRVEMEDNQSLRSIDPRHADYVAADDDRSTAELLMLKLVSYLGTEQFRLQEPESPPFELD